LLRRSPLLHGKRNSLWCRNTINKRSATSHLVDAIPIVIVMPFAVQPKSSDGLFYLPHHTVNITKSLSLGVIGCPKGLHSPLFVVGVVSRVSVSCHQTRIVKALISIDVARADRSEENLCSQAQTFNSQVEEDKQTFIQ
jgi:hypothetical protein